MGVGTWKDGLLPGLLMTVTRRQGEGPQGALYGERYDFINQSSVNGLLKTRPSLIHVVSLERKLEHWSRILNFHNAPSSGGRKLADPK